MEKKDRYLLKFTTFIIINQIKIMATYIFGANPNLPIGVIMIIPGIKPRK